MTIVMQKPKIRGYRTPKKRQRDLNAGVRSSFNAFWNTREWHTLHNRGEFIAQREREHLLAGVQDAEQLGWTYASEAVHEYHATMTEIEDTVTLQDYLLHPAPGHIIDENGGALVIHC